MVWVLIIGQCTKNKGSIDHWFSIRRGGAVLTREGRLGDRWVNSLSEGEKFVGGGKENVNFSKFFIIENIKVIFYSCITYFINLYC